MEFFSYLFFVVKITNSIIKKPQNREKNTTTGRPNEGLASKPSKLKVKAAGIAMANFVEVALQRLLLLFCYPPSKAWPSVRKMLWWLKLQQLYVLLGNVRHTKIWLLKFFFHKNLLSHKNGKQCNFYILFIRADLVHQINTVKAQRLILVGIKSSNLPKVRNKSLDYVYVVRYQSKF